MNVDELRERGAMKKMARIIINNRETQISREGERDIEGAQKYQRWGDRKRGRV